jgi:hypothetical protein
VTIEVWLGARDPQPPAELADRIRSVLGSDTSLPIENGAECFLSTAERIVRRSIAEELPGREAALDLLVADALVTYAFELTAGSGGDLVTVSRSALRRLGAMVGESQ